MTVFVASQIPDRCSCISRASSQNRRPLSKVRLFVKAEKYTGKFELLFCPTIICYLANFKDSIKQPSVYNRVATTPGNS